MKQMLIASMFFVLGFSGQVFRNEGNARLAPRLLNYQGYLTDTQGNPVTNPSVSMTFAIFDAASTGSQKWTETQSAVAVDKGIFNVLLGSVAPIPDSVFLNSTSRWLELTVGGQTLTPRTRVVSSAYAYTSTYADTAIYALSFKADTDWIFSGNNIYSGVSGNVGIGTATPNAMLSFGTSVVDNKVYLYDGASTKYGLGIRSAELMVYCGPGGHTAFGHYDGTTFTERMRMDYLGNLGLGTSSPVAKLDINGGAVFRRMDGDTICRWSIWNNSISSSGDYGLYFAKNGAGNYLVLGNSSNNSYFPSGNVGVGTATPATKFDVAGYVRSTGSDDVGGGLSIFNSSKTGAIVNNWMIFNMTGVYGNALKFWRYYQDGSNPGPSLTLYDNGNAYFTSNVGIGVAWPVCPLQVNGVICGGTSNIINSLYGVVIGGNGDLVGDAVSDTGSVIVGGFYNMVSGKYGFIGGGRRNVVSAYFYGTVCGGDSNIVSGNFSAIGGGMWNLADGIAHTIAGGQSNQITSQQCGTIGGGSYNSVTANYATIGGGLDNRALATWSTIAGGRIDTVYANYSFATNFKTVVHLGDTNSAVFTSSHTTAPNQVRAASFSTGSIDFAMDHPDDPMNKILNQYGVSSDEVMSIYRGSIILDAGGHAKVDLPYYFDDINRNPMVQLTGVGTFEVYVAEDVRGNQFMIGGKPGTKVYWVVTAERKDIQAEIARVQTPIMQEKKDGLRGHSIDDDAMIGIYDGLHKKNPELFKFKTDEGHDAHQMMKKVK